MKFIKRTGPAGCYMLNRDQPLTNLVSTYFTNTVTRGVSIRIRFKDLCPTSATPDWTYFNTNVAACVTGGKRVLLRINSPTQFTSDFVPTWLINSGALLFPYTASGAGATYCGVPWDQKYLDIWHGILKSFATNFATNSQVDMIYIGGLDIAGGEFTLPRTAPDVAQWNSAPYSYTAAKLVAAWADVIDMYSYLFPNKFIGLCAQSAITSNEGVSEAILAYAVQKLGWRCHAQTNVLELSMNLAGTPQIYLDTVIGKCSQGYQEAVSCSSSTANADRWRGDSAGTNINITDFAAGIDLGVNHSHSQLIEGYPDNLNDILGIGTGAVYRSRFPT